jgi:hypothetical protein
MSIKHGGDWCSKEVGGPYGVGTRKCIRREWDGFANCVRYEEGDGSRVLFWHDVWCGKQPLTLSFRNYSQLLVARMHGWRIICNYRMEIFIRILYLLDRCMIER